MISTASPGLDGFGRNVSPARTSPMTLQFTRYVRGAHRKSVAGGAGEGRIIAIGGDCLRRARGRRPRRAELVPLWRGLYFAQDACRASSKEIAAGMGSLGPLP